VVFFEKMAIPPLSLTSSFLKTRPRHVVAHHHLMLAGINQSVFLKQWGEPETQMGLNPLGNLCKLGSLFLIVDSTEDVYHSVWIYKKRDRILFFTRKKLTSHFKWSEFKEKCNRPKGEMDSRLSSKPPVFTVTTLALVA
jgi:hypothetical protein